MKPSLKRLSPRRDRGFALVIILAFVVLLTGLVIAFLSQAMSNRQVSNGSANEAKADLLAKSALDVVVSDLKQEIAAGSTTDTVNSVSLYTPTLPAGMLPQRSGTATTTPNLVRRSVRSDTIAAPGVASRASIVSSSDASLNGYAITPARWNSHYLLPRFDQGTGTAATPDVSAQFVPPDWVMVTRTGPKVVTAVGSGSSALNNASPANDNFVVGRYAYAIYDEGALLDMNVAGYPSGLSADQLGQKGPVALADLTQLPIKKSPSGAADYLTQTQLDQIIGWRNRYTAQTGGTFGAFSFSPAASSNWLTNFVRQNASGFRQVTGDSGLSDQAFLSRQQLIKMARAVGLDLNSLQYLGTFSRELNAPSWAPSSNASALGGIDNGVDTTAAATGVVIPNQYAYKDNSNVPTSFNRALSKVRVVTAFTRLDGSVALPGDPLVAHRFDLSRVGWITHDGTLPSGVSATDIRNYFGLTRSSSTGAWVYDHGAPGNGTKIMTLDEVAKATPAREPDFFELLQAGILRGGLGSVSGDPTQRTSITSGGEFFRAGNFGWQTTIVRTDTGSNVVYAQEPYQIIQIGANIIDQADADSYPTEIQLNGESFFGIENLPYINGVADTALRPRATDGAVTQLKRDYQAYVHRWLTFSLWNPHQNANVIGPNSPDAMRIFVDQGQARPQVQNTPTTAYPPIEPYVKIIDFSLENASLKFSRSRFLGRFSEPTTLDYDRTDDALPPIGKVATELGWKRAGIYMGYSYSPDNPTRKVPACAPIAYDTPQYTAAATTIYNAARFNFIVPLTVKLQYLDPVSNSWRSVQELRGLIHSRDGGGDPYMEPSDPAWATIAAYHIAEGGPLAADQEAWVLAFLDPRTARLNLPARRNLRLAENYLSDGLLVSAPAGPHFVGAATWTSWVNNISTATSYYTDRDSVRRVGDAAGWAGADPQVALNLTGRPLMLDRPFRNVGELGYVFRDDPWKTLNLVSINSADAALLDVFCVGGSPAPGTATPSVVAGKVSINSASSPVLQSIIQGAARTYQLGSPTSMSTAISKTEAQGIVTDIKAKITSAGPFVNVSDLTKVYPQDASISIKYPGNMAAREAMIRSLADTSNTRTWNLLIDIIAQSGRFPPNAVNLTNFSVEGEKRYWLHLALDRYTGQIVDQQLEPVSE